MENNIEKKKFYTNSIGIEASVFDIKLNIGYLTTNGEEKEKKEELCQIAMSPQHAKAFLNVLNATIKQYEENFGEIRLNSNTTKKGE